MYGSAKKHDEKKGKDDEQTLPELSSAHRRSQAKCQLVQTIYIKRIKLFLFARFLFALFGVSTDLTAFGLYSRPRSRFSHTDLLLS